MQARGRRVKRFDPIKRLTVDYIHSISNRSRMSYSSKHSRDSKLENRSEAKSSTSNALSTCHSRTSNASQAAAEAARTRAEFAKCQIDLEIKKVKIEATLNTLRKRKVKLKQLLQQQKCWNQLQTVWMTLLNGGVLWLLSVLMNTLEHTFLRTRVSRKMIKQVQSLKTFLESVSLLLML